MSNKNIDYPDLYKLEDYYNYILLELHYNKDSEQNHFKTQYKFIKSVLLEYIVYLYDDYFLSDLLKNEYEVYKEIRGNAIREVEKKLIYVKDLLINPSIGNYFNYFHDSMYGKLAQVKDYTTDYDVELCKQYFKMVYDSTKVDEESFKPCNTSRFFRMLEDKLLNEKGYSQIMKEAVIGPDKLLSAANEKISRSCERKGNEPYFYNLIKDIKRFTLNFQNEKGISDYTKYLANLFGVNYEKEIYLQNQIPNNKGVLYAYNYKLHVKCVKNSFAQNTLENEYKDLKIVFEVKILETNLVFQVELQCNLKAFADWKTTDHVFYDFSRTKDAFYQLKNEYYEFMWYESNDRTFLIICLNLIWITAFFFILTTTVLLDDYYEYFKTDNIDVLLKLGLKYKNLGYHEKSLEYFEKIEKLNNNDNSLVSNEDNYSYSLILIKNKKYDKAFDFLNKLVMKDGNKIEYLISLAKIYMNYKINYEKAIEYLMKAEEINPGNVKVYYNIGKAYFSNNDYKNALVYLRKAIQLYTNNLDANYYEQKSREIVKKINKSDYNSGFFNQGRIELSRRNYDEAIYNFHLYLFIDPNNYDANFLLGKAYLGKNEYDEAIKYFQKSLIIDPNKLDANFLLGKAYLGKKIYDEAIKYFHLYLFIDPNNYDANFLLGKAYLDKNEYDEAIKYFQKSLIIDPNNYDANFLLGKAYLGKNKYDEAIKYFQKSLNIDPNNYDANFLLGKAMFGDKLYDEAIKYFDKAIEINPDDKKNNNFKGYAYLGLKKFNNAIDWLEKTIKKDSKNNLDSLKIIAYAYKCKNDLINAKFWIYWYNIKNICHYETTDEVIKSFLKDIEFDLVMGNIDISSQMDKNEKESNERCDILKSKNYEYNNKDGPLQKYFE